MHKLLQRQIRRQFGSVDAAPEGLARFIAAVDDAYAAFDQDRVLYERSLDLTSEELMAKNRMLQRESSEIRQIIARVPEGLAVVSGGRFLLVNPKWCAYLGYSGDELAGAAVLDHVFEEDHPVFLRRIQEGAQTNTNGTEEVTFRTKSGARVLLEFSPAQQIGFDGEPAVLLGARDVTNRKRDDQRAMHAARMASMGALTAGIAHELNNPLCYVIANLGFVAEKVGLLDGMNPSLAEMKEALRDAREGTERVRVIVHDLKAFSRSDSENTGPISLRRVVEGAAKLAMSEIRSRATLVLELGSIAPADGNESKLGQVVINLLVNAAQAIPEGRAADNFIKVTTRQDGDRVCLEVTDSGAGMPEEVQAKVFEPFFTTKPIGVGTGLGLAICHGIVSGMNGRIEVESQLGKGTTFRVWLPVSHDECVRAPSPTAIAKRGRILVVDDEPKVGASIRRALSEHDVICLSSGAEALAWLRAEGGELDLLLCDLMMPNMTGVELFELLPPAVKARTAFVTGGALTESTREFLARTTNPTIAKPFTTESLQTRVAELLLRRAVIPRAPHLG